MELKRIGFATVFVILLCALATGRAEGNRRTLMRQGSPETNTNMAEQEWVHCRKEMRGKKGTHGDLNLYFLKEATGDWFPRRKIQRAVSVLPPQMKERVVDCLKEKILLFDVSRQEAVYRHCFIKCIELIFDCSSVPRRYLAGESRHQIAPTRSPTQAPIISVAASNHDPSPASSKSPNKQPFHFSPEGENIVIDSPPPHAARKHSPPMPPVNPNHSKKNYDNIESETIVAVVVTAAGTFLIVALICCCIRGRSNKVGPRGRRDDRPLLSLSSSQKSLSLGSSSKELGLNSISGKTTFISDLSVKTENHDSSLPVVPSSETASVLHLKPPPGQSAPPPPGPPPPPPAPRPPPPKARLPPVPPKGMPGKGQPSPLGPHRQGSSGSAQGEDDIESGSQKAKLKPFFWDKVLANPDQSMVWHEIKAGSFQFNEELIETLFGYNADRGKNDRKRESSSQDHSIQYIKIIDPRKAQNLSILLKALGVTTEEVIDALQEGNELPVELLQTLLKMAPTQEEELKLRLFAGDVSQLGPAERFLKVLVEIPFAFKRVESLLFMCSLPEEVSILKESYETLEVACNKLRNNRLFLKLLEAVLKTGNRMNDGTYRGGAQAFKLDTLLKLSDVKGIDGKTTLLHFVVQEIIRSEGIKAIRKAKASSSFSSVRTEDFVDDSSPESAERYRCLGLEVVSGLSTELEDVKKAAAIDLDVTAATVSKLKKSLIKTREFLDIEKTNSEEDSEFHRALVSFVERTEFDISWLSEEEKRITSLVKSTADYFHGHAGKDEGLRLFTIVREFLTMVDKICKEVKDDATAKPMRAFRKEALSTSASATASPDNRPPPSDFRHRIADRRMDYSSSDDEVTSP
ncbi:putative Formin 3 [Tripterygium wilfordii]|uniref:Formin-like protein n=1 Tax=Tripterygium wilfordii TaxID=458696 RepID=A0A7J7DI45_TRIWF|nr:putative Formin 3 [Tripterygium wilfordii]